MRWLSPSQVRTFQETGFLVVPGFFSEEEVARAQESYDTVWRDQPSDVTVDAVETRRRVRAPHLTQAERAQPFKVNDLYLRDEGLRDVVLSRRLGGALGELLEDDPVVCNTLSLAYGTQQADHLDTLYMTPRTEGRLVATWTALEDVDDDAGPLRYFPESNHIEPYRFADGTFHYEWSQMDRWADYMAGEVERHGLEETRFLARRGDLFIWDAWLLHGGSEICRPGLTRSSVVTHYFTRTDSLALGSALRPGPGGWWTHRDAPTPEHGPGDPGHGEPGHRPVGATPEWLAEQGLTEQGLVPAGDIPEMAPVPETGADVLPSRELHERLVTLGPED